MKEYKDEPACENCRGWYNVCSPDWYPDYVDPDDPANCSGYDPVVIKE